MPIHPADEQATKDDIERIWGELKDQFAAKADFTASFDRLGTKAAPQKSRAAKPT